MKHLTRLSTILLLLILTNLATYSQIHDWRGPNRTGVYNEKNLLKKWPASGPKLLWDISDIGFAYSSATVTKETVYVTGRKGDDDVLTALTLDGKEKWNTIYGKAWTRNFEGTRCTPTIVGDRIFLVSGIGEIVCINTNGKNYCFSWRKQSLISCI